MCENNGKQGACFEKLCAHCRPSDQKLAGPRYDAQRGTGRSGRAVVAALCAMLRGQNVLHVSASMATMQYNIDTAMQWLNDNGWTNVHDKLPSAYMPTKEKIVFGKGEVKFVPMEANQRGLRPDVVILDHTVEEETERRRLVKEREQDAATIKELMRKHEWTHALDCQIAPGAKPNKIVFRT